MYNACTMEAAPSESALERRVRHIARGRVCDFARRLCAIAHAEAGGARHKATVVTGYSSRSVVAGSTRAARSAWLPTVTTATRSIDRIATAKGQTPSSIR